MVPDTGDERHPHVREGGAGAGAGARCIKGGAGARHVDGRNEAVRPTKGGGVRVLVRVLVPAAGVFHHLAEVAAMVLEPDRQTTAWATAAAAAAAAETSEGKVAGIA